MSDIALSLLSNWLTGNSNFTPIQDYPTTTCTLFMGDNTMLSFGVNSYPKLLFLVSN